MCSGETIPVCMYVCMYVCICSCMHVNESEGLYSNMYVCPMCSGETIPACMHVCICSCMYVNESEETIPKDVCMHVCVINMCMHMLLNVCE